MAEITEELRVLVTAEVDKAIKNLNQLDRKTEKTSSDFEKLGKAIGSALLVKAAVDFGKASVRAAEDAKQKFSLLKTTIDTTGASAWTSIDAMSQMSKKLSDSTNYSVSEIQSMQTVLLGFKNITDDTFREASGAIMDMATVMGMDLKSAVQTVGKALDDPINGIDSLKRQGFAFTDSQKSMLKTMVKTGDQAGAQKIILEELATTYGGAAQAAQTSFAKLEHSMDDLKETVGNILTPMLADIAEKAVNLLEKFNSLDDGTQQMIVTAGALVAATPAVITAIGGVKKALIALQAANPVLLGISLGVAGITTAVAVFNEKNNFAKFNSEVQKTKKSSDELLKSFSKGNPEKKLDADITQKLIKLYPELAGKIDAYSTSVDEASRRIKDLTTAKVVENESKAIAKYKKLLQQARQELHDAQQELKEGGESNADIAKEYLARYRTALAAANEELKKINEQLEPVGKMLSPEGDVINAPIRYKPKITVDTPETENVNESEIKKAWQEWLSKILKVDQSLFKTGEQAANIYIDGLERAFNNESRISEILDEKFDAAGFLDSQMSEISSKVKEMLNVSPDEIDEVFKIEDSAVKTLLSEYEVLKKRKHEAYISDEVKDLSKQIAEASMSEKQRYLETVRANGATEEEITLLAQLYDELELASADSWTEKLSLGIQDLLEDFDGLDAKSRQVLGDLAANFASISLDSALTGFEEFGRALGQDKDATDSLHAALSAMAEEILNQLPTMFLQAGLQLIAQGMWPLGLGFIAAAGSSAAIKGYVDGKKSSAKEETKTNALGGVYGDNGYSAFAKGGTFTNAIVSSPTFFKFAKGSGFGTGLMGEAGPEAVMPLTRGADGSLGVTASGLGSNVEVNIPITVYSDEPVEVNETTDENGQRKIEMMVGSMINRHLSDGSADRALKSRYGLKVQGV